MARPNEFLQWAEDSTFATGEAAGQPTTELPTTSEQRQGFVPGTGFVGEYANRMLRNFTRQLLYLYQYAYDSAEEHSYENPQLKTNVYPLHHGWNPFVSTDFSAYDGTQITSTVNDACWVVPLRGIPAGAQIRSIQVRAKTHNNSRPSTPKARMELIRYSKSALLNLSDPLDYDSGANPGWEIVYNGASPPGPFYVEFPSIGFQETFAGPTAFRFIETGYEYALRLWGGTDAGAHQPDSFFGVAVDWMDYGPRSGG